MTTKTGFNLGPPEIWLIAAAVAAPVVVFAWLTAGSPAADETPGGPLGIAAALAAVAAAAAVCLARRLSDRVSRRPSPRRSGAVENGDIPSTIWLGRDQAEDGDDRGGPGAAALPQATPEVELRALQRQLATAKAEADAAEHARARFMAAAAHDMRQPFQAMNLYLQVLDNLELPPTARTPLRHLTTSVRSGEELLTALLDISALEAGTVVPQISRFRLVDLLDELFTEYGAVAAERGLSLRRFVIDVEVETDRVLAKRMVRNLLHNAFRYIKRGGVLLGCRRRGSRVLVQVYDQGPGIPPDKLQLIFAEFYRLDQGAGDRSRGLGLGLTIVQRTAHLLGQEVWVSSAPDHGSVFSVSLPLAAAREGPELPKDSAKV